MMPFDLAKTRAAKYVAERPSLVTKSLNVGGPGMLKEGMSEPSVFRRFPQAKSALVAGTLTDSVALMIDLSPFSRVVSESTPTEIHRLLASYYDVTVKAIETHGGVVEKYIGDAVVALFGAPFRDGATAPSDVSAAFTAGRVSIALVHDLFGGQIHAKCAISRGQLFLGYIGPSSHPELTAVGNPLTVLFRLEDTAEPREIVLTLDTYKQIAPTFIKVPAGWRSSGKTWDETEDNIELRGVGPTKIMRCRVDV